jgi:hypothetical protein
MLSEGSGLLMELPQLIDHAGFAPLSRVREPKLNNFKLPF